MARLFATLFAALAALALVHSAAGACVTQIDASTCLVGWTAADDATCLDDVNSLVNGDSGCNEYAFVKADTDGVCLLKKENCSPGDIVNTDNSPADACPSAVLTLADSLTFECSGTAGPTPTPTPTPSSPSGAASFVGFCTYSADYCGTIFQPSDSATCDDLIGVVISSTNTDCSAWNYAASDNGCYMQYLEDDSSCTYINTLVDAVNSSNSTDAFEDNGTCDDSLLPTDLTFSDPCSLPATPSSTSPPDSSLGGPPAPRPPGITLFPVGIKSSPPPVGSSSSKASPPPAPRSFTPPPTILTAGAIGGARMGAVVALVLAAALAFAL